MSCSYTGIETSKDGKQIPACNAICFHSKYSPEREAQSFASQFDSSGFFIIPGLCGGYHIQALLQKFPEAKIIAVEKNEEDLNFLGQIEAVKELKAIPNIIFSTINELELKILQNYLPAVDGNLISKPLRQWEIQFKEEILKTNEIIQSALKKISADYSVQKHFGKIWHHNILSNLSNSKYSQNFNDFAKNFDLSKTAAIIAAGPSLNESISELRANRSKYFIVSTDTAFSTLVKNGIYPEIAVSVDGQMISHSHFFEKSPSTKFVFDLCSNTAAVKNAIKNNNDFIFVETGHPLSQFAATYSGKRSFAHLETGSGTVTIAAADFARLSGFKKIKFFGADFSYLNGLPYAKGTYLDSIYRRNETKISPAENKFTHLLYRTEIIQLSPAKITTEVLNSYRQSLEEYNQSHGLKKISENFYETTENPLKFSAGSFDFIEFRELYLKKLKECFKSENEFDRNQPVFQTLLPLCAALDQPSPFLAYTKTLVYTNKI